VLGKPVLKGTRIPVEHIVRKLGEGTSVYNFPDAYTQLAKEAIGAALIYAADESYDFAVVRALREN